MGHKVHPKSFRIKGVEDWNVRGFYGANMSHYLEEDFLIKDFLRTILVEASVANIEIEHSANKLNIIIESARPGLIIGRGGEGVETLKKMIVKKMHDKVFSTNRLGQENVKREIKIDIKEIKNPWISSMLVAQWAAQQLEKRIPFRQVLKMGLERVMQNKEAKGVRIEVSGRLNGVEIARREYLLKGRMPRQTIRADIDYAQYQAFCTYGVIGIKVWIYKGEKFDK
ncbi:MAG: 30S ribosomal protein S3 [Candidatus Staskawiczbacteria bacterium RIFCSPLOWO2_01_FULL_38_12b]|uniref:Small ribosomal subunit protein uS3 n=1 Tax=Candidatus Staskawiczbacteria bacterium RIFCSPLOWO2_01_FULL_38_12b TaxID=1802214 RepID=A0A1G2IFQ6_9BACT|nr:MAG: 30S ribosomal protein S3 [Candidatus Staskawiczbacteria bacterium RIFCSPLOWO2_01_FULL_38_12b]